MTVAIETLTADQQAVLRTAIAAAGGAVTPIGLPASFTSVVGFGDSIVAGSNATVDAKRWLNIVSAALGAGVPLNAGIAGTVLQNSPDSSGLSKLNNGRDRYATAVLGANKRQAVFIGYGYNDARYVGAPSTFNVTQYGADLREVLNALIAAGYGRDQIVGVSPYFISDAGLATGSTGFSGQTRAGFEAFVAKAAEVYAEFGVFYADVYAYMRDNGGTALIDSDFIHPNDLGHAVIAEGVLRATRSISRGAPGNPAGVSAGSGIINVTVEAAAGVPSGYEWKLISDPYTVATMISRGPSAAFSGVIGGVYRLACRALYGLSAGPWGFAAAAINVPAAAGVTFLSASFTAADDTALGNYLPEVGREWLIVDGLAPTAPAKIEANRVAAFDALDVYFNAVNPPSANYYVEAKLDYLSTISSDSIAVAARIQNNANTFYWAGYSRSAGGWRLFKTVAGVNTQLGATQAATFTSGSRVVRLTVQGSTVAFAVDGATLVSVTDTEIPLAGHPGLRLGVIQTASTGIQVDSLLAVTV